LISNAVKYTRRGSDVEITADVAGDRVEVRVADRGPGVPDEFKRLIFEKFGTVEDKRGQQRRGFGLGLHLVQLVAEAHGGVVGVRDREGGGAVFVLSLPLAA
jgi:signal transduction histidine kinase